MLENLKKRLKKEIPEKLVKVMTGYSKTEINKTFLIKITGQREGKKYHNLVGVTGLIEAVGFCISRKMLYRAFKMDKKEGKEVCKLRTGLTVIFYYK